MAKMTFVRSVSFLAAFGLLIPLTGLAGAETPPERTTAEPQIASTQHGQFEMSWLPHVKYSAAALTVSAPDGSSFRKEFDAGQAIVFSLADVEADVIGDGQYNFELTFSPTLDAATLTALDQARQTNDDSIIRGLTRLGAIPAEPMVHFGSFRVKGGAIVTDVDAPENAAETKDIVHLDDVIAVYSMCIGNDCVNGENFGFDTLRLKENNLRIHFYDTSTSASFPTNDWRITINDSANGGLSYFAVQDASEGTTPFTIEASAGANALYVDDYGRVGLGTSSPAVELHVSDGDTPTVRLDQDGTGGWSPQRWDVAGNEANFFIRDVTNGSKLPFRIQPSTPSSTLNLKADGQVGIGTWSPESTLEIETTGKDAELRLDRTDSGAWVMAAKEDQTFTIGFADDGQTFLTLKSNGAIKAGGPVNGLSDRNAKQDFSAIDRAALLGRLAALDVSEWSYISEGPGVRHVGPTAQDFQAAFGLGDDDTHISLADLSGIALAAIQELHLRLEQRDREIAELRKRLEALENNLQ
jgi:hypothetical protein